MYRIYPLAELLIFFALLRLEMSLPISQPLAADAFKRIVGALSILNAEFRAIVVPEVKFGQIAMQVL